MDIQDLSLVRRVAPITGRVLAIVLAALVALSGLLVMQTPRSPSPPTVVTSSGKRPLSFVPNSGQTDPEVRFVVRGMGGTLFFTPDGVLMASPAAVARLAFQGANPSPQVVGLDRLPGVVNYYLGDDPAQWRTNLPTYAEVEYHQLYPGVDLRYDGLSGSLKGTYTVSPGADPTLIRWRYEGATEVRVDEATGNLLVRIAAMGPHPNPGGEGIPGADGDGRWGELGRGVGADGPVLQGGGGASPRVQMPEGEGIAPLSASLIEGAPAAWQTVNGRLAPVEARYILYGDAAAPAIGFALGAYDPALPLIIDPALSYSTYLGGSASDTGKAIAVDVAGNTYVTGETESTDFPGMPGTNSGDKDAFVAKLNPTGSALVYTTYIGGGALDRGHAIAVDSAGNAYLTGSTESSNFPTRNPAQNTLRPSGATNAFIAKLNATGALSYSTYLGETSYVIGLGIAVDSASSAYITGNSSGEVLLAKLDTSGALVYWGTFGGTSWDQGNAIAVDGDGNAYVTGRTESRNFPTTAGALQLFCDQGTTGSVCSQDAFVVKVSQSGETLLYGTFLGGTNTDEGNAIAVDSAGNIYVAGDTLSRDFPTVNPVRTAPCDPNGVYCPNVFVAKLNSSGSALQYSTILGGGQEDNARGIAVDSAGSAYVAGKTRSPNFPVSDPVQPSFGAGLCPTNIWPDRFCWDAFVVKLTPSGDALAYGTFLGGAGDDEGNGIAVDSAGNAYVTGYTTRGLNVSSNFPTTAGVVQPSSGGNFREAFVSKIAPGDAPGATPTPTTTPIGSVTPTATPGATATVTTTPSPTVTTTPTGTVTPIVSPTTTPVPGLLPRAYLPLGVRSYGGAW